MKRKLPHVWSIILAGGSGNRMQPFIGQWLGQNIPKQYCSFIGERSLFQHTLERTGQFHQPEQTIAVISQADKEIASLQMAPYPGGAVMMQPRNCDTGPGVFLPLSYLKLIASDATVIILPSDHFIYPSDRFHHVLTHAVNALEKQSEQLILLGVRPNTPETEYGWIKRGPPIGKDEIASLYRVQSFIEKPPAPIAEHLKKTGGLWNTMILVGKVSTFWNLGWLVFPPPLMQKFRAFQAFIGSQWEQSMLEHMYMDMPVCNLSRGFLQKIPNYLTVLEMTNVLWSDWGQPRRIFETLQAIGKTPNFPCDRLHKFLSNTVDIPSLPSTSRIG
ncbi:MAG: sugar phosphate nucleotidyltransferase [Nitrospirales bacterium]